LKDSAIVIQSLNYQSEYSWIEGSRRGSSAILEASKTMDLYDIETQSEVFKKGVHLIRAMELTGLKAEEMYDEVFVRTMNLMESEQFPVFLGGDHVLSIPIIDALMEKYADLSILHLDSGADLLPESEGTSYHPSCVMHRASRQANLVQVGIRNMNISERRYLDREKCFFAHDIHDHTFWMNEAIDRLTSPVYLSIDLSVFDPALCPHTTSPEPGGLDWYSTIEFLRMVHRRKNVIGLDIMGLCPGTSSQQSDLLAARLLYKLLSYKYFG
jgi:agmatinase